MSTETQTPAPIAVAAAAPQTPPTPPPEVVAIAAAEEAQRRYTEATAAVTAQAAAGESETARLKRELEELKAKFATLEPHTAQAQRHYEREATAARLSAIKAMGAVDLGDENLLKLAPAVDPRDPDGRAQLEAWRTRNAHLFRAQGPTQADLVASVAPSVAKFKSSLFSAEKLVGQLLGGGRK